QWGNSEVFFSGSTTLDNGLKVAAKVELEANQGAASDSIDRSFLTISSDEMGALSMGAMPHAADDMDVRAPNAGNLDWRDTDNFAGSATAATAATAAYTNSSNSIYQWGNNDGIKLKYASPNFSGVTVGGSWGGKSSGNETEDNRLTLTSAEDSWTVGAKYSGDFDGVGVKASLVHGSGAVTNVEQTQVGLSVSTAGFTIGGGYSDFDDTRDNPTASNDGEGWELGVGYETGPYSVSAAYMTSSNKDTTATAGDNEDTKWNVVATYDMGAGVALSATYFKSEADQEGTTAAVDVNGLIAGIEVGF
ncbi:MAG: porin, partial [Magnetovibrio sp.]|nr:porin [Magnetovibrio sp.]